jgi:hypothetical protein
MRYGVGRPWPDIPWRVVGPRRWRTRSSEHLNRLVGLLDNRTLDIDNLHIEDLNE